MCMYVSKLSANYRDSKTFPKDKDKANPLTRIGFGVLGYVLALC